MLRSRRHAHGTGHSRVVALLALLASLMTLPGAALAGDPIGRVVQQEGAVTVQRAEDRVPLWPGDPVFIADRVLTGPDGRVRIAFQDESLLAIGSDSEVVVDDFRIGRDGRRLNAVISLLLGIVRAAVTPAAPSVVFDVRTRVALASARSTDWIVEAKPDHTAVFVAEGLVDVTASGGQVLLGSGLGTDVMAGRAPTSPKRWGEARVRDVMGRTALE